jgi:heme A synthase
MRSRRFTNYAWGILVYNVGVILWGAYVRATGSGAGCGNRWPLCDGVVLPRAPRLETMIEFSHRASSGLALLLVAGLFIWAFRAYPKGHTVRLGAALSLLFIITEALVGAGLVLFDLVADNATATRAVSIAVHLVNTFLLLSALALTAHWASGAPPLRLRGQGTRLWALGIGLLGLLILGMTGAITALGDTLFPAESLATGLRQDLDPTANFMIQLRVVHPVVAVAVSFYLILITGLPDVTGPRADAKRLARLLTVLFVIQLIAGGANVLLLAPVWMQLLHLLLADLGWIALVLLAATSLSETEMAETSVLTPQPGSEGIVLSASSTSPQSPAN